MLDKVRGTLEERVDGASSASTAEHYVAVRSASRHLVRTLSAEDCALQSMPDASPAKWHLAHTTWFFEQFVLARDSGYQPFQEDWHYLFNSYYQSVGPMHSRPKRGLLSRPSLEEVLSYRDAIDQRIQELLLRSTDSELARLIELGLHHEQQHQELVLTDLKHLFSCNPLKPAVFDRNTFRLHGASAIDLRFIDGQQGVVDIGHQGEQFSFDCETPRHKALLQAHTMANRCISNAEYREFIEEGGYRSPQLWLSEGWNRVQQEGWNRPLYWEESLDSEFTLHGIQALDPAAAVCHVSHFEADAFARWAGARLPTEFEWESAAAEQSPQGHFADRERYHPLSAPSGDGLVQLFGDVWEWTASAFLNYPGYRPLAGSLGEYNGKFMNGQMVLRGGSCVTPAGHMRASYRNFFYPADRWQFMGIRLAKDAS